MWEQVYFLCILFLFSMLQKRAVVKGIRIESAGHSSLRFSEVSYCPRQIARRCCVRMLRCEGMDFFRVPVFGKRHDQILGFEFQPFYYLAAVSSEGGRFPVQRLWSFLV